MFIVKNSSTNPTTTEKGIRMMIIHMINTAIVKQYQKLTLY